MPAACAASTWKAIAAGPDERADRRDRLQHADLVVGGHDADEDGVRAERGVHRRGIDEPAGVDAEPRHLDRPVRFERGADVEHRGVLGRQGHDVASAGAERAHRAGDRQVVRLGGAAREDDVARPRADQRGDLTARVLDRLARRPAEGMLRARRVAEALGEVRQHRRDDPRIARRRGVAVEIEGIHSRARRERVTGWSSGPALVIGTSVAISSRLQAASDVRIRSLMRHSGSRTLHFEYWPQP